MIHGYARVSTDGQSVDAQLRQLRTAGASQVFRETARGANLTPHQMKEAIKRRDAGEPVREIARSYNVSHSTTSRLAA